MTISGGVLLLLVVTGCAGTRPPPVPRAPLEQLLDRVLVDVLCWPALAAPDPRRGLGDALRGPLDRCA